MAMTEWTDELPKVAGWYWMQSSAGHKCVVNIDMDGDHAYLDLHPHIPDGFYGSDIECDEHCQSARWYGPIEPPPDPTK